jgi:hypothetical protein
MVPLCYQPWTTIRRPGIEGFWTNPLQAGHLTDISVRR